MLFNIECAHATTTFSRFNFGSFVARESLDSNGTKNDLNIISSRAFLRAAQLYDRDLDFAMDIRDKNDFFDKFSSERLELTSKNDFQVRQFSLRSSGLNGNWFGSLGRFSLYEAGGANVDGAEMGIHFSDQLRAGVFGGLEPQRSDQTVMRFNKDSTTAGGYFLFQPNVRGLGESFFINSAVTSEMVLGHLDRLYVFFSSVRQWKNTSLVSLTAYVDTTPTVRLQNGNFTYRFPIGESFYSTVNATAIDSIQYFRSHGLLETLPSSAYREGAFELTNKWSRNVNLDTQFSYGERALDSLTRQEVSFGPHFLALVKSKLALKTVVGYRKNFTYNDYFGRISGDYYLKSWTFGLTGDFGMVKYNNDEVGRVPFVVSGSTTYQPSRTWFAMISVEQARSAQVNIVSAFLKLGYQIGSNDIAPKRHTIDWSRSRP